MKLSSVLRVIVIVLITVFFIHQGFYAFYNPIKTESAVFYTAVDDFKITGFVREENNGQKNSNSDDLHVLDSDEHFEKLIHRLA